MTPSLISLENAGEDRVKMFGQRKMVTVLLITICMSRSLYFWGYFYWQHITVQGVIE